MENSRKEIDMSSCIFDSTSDMCRKPYGVYRRNGNDSNRLGCDYYENMIVGGDVIINNITHVSNITYVPNASKQHRGRRHHERIERKPELLRFYQSCGLLGQDKVMRMSDRQLVYGTAAVLGYAGRQLGCNFGGIGSGVVKMSRGVGGVVKSVFGMITTLLE